MAVPSPRTSRVGLAALCLLAAHLGLAPSGLRAQIASIALTRNGDLSFGQIVTGVSSGTVVITPSGSRSATGGAMLGNGAAASVASFTVSGEPLATFAVTLPSSITISNGSQTMTIDAFTSTPSGTGTLDASGSETLTLGATLQLGASQASGAYAGSFSVRVDYN